jgi:hypothetical protein
LKTWSYGLREEHNKAFRVSNCRRTGGKYMKKILVGSSVV